MGVNTEKFIKKPLYVDGVRITAENFDEVAAWCQGEILTEDIPGRGATKKYIKVRVHSPKILRQTQAFIGDWLLYTERGYKVYTNKAFRASFDPVDPTKDIPAAPAVIAGNGEVVEATLERSPTFPQPVMEELASGNVQKSDIVDEQPVADSPMVSDSDSAPPPQTEDGRRILTAAEQAEMDTEEVGELLRSGEAVLEQDLV